MDVSGKALKEALNEGVFLIKPNVREFRELVGEEIKEESQIKAEAQKMVKSGRCEVLIISLVRQAPWWFRRSLPNISCRPPCPLSARSGPGTAWSPVSP